MLSLLEASVADVREYFADLSLARRLERAEGRSGASFVETRARVRPESGACWIEAAGAYAMFDGVDSPVTQSFGLGVFDEVGENGLRALEEFFLGRQAPVSHEISPLADGGLFALLNERGYRPIEFTNVLFLPLARRPMPSRPPNERIRVRLTGDDEWELWANTAVAGWSEAEELAEVLPEMMEIGAKDRDARTFLAEIDGRAIAAASLFVQEGVGLLGGACTIPDARKQGAQAALLDRRLRFAAEHGCDLAMMCALPGSTSQRNAERQGFRIAYTRTKWRLESAA